MSIIIPAIFVPLNEKMTGIISLFSVFADKNHSADQHNNA